jgi:hypothetical protein
MNIQKMETIQQDYGLTDNSRNYSPQNTGFSLAVVDLRGDNIQLYGCLDESFVEAVEKGHYAYAIHAIKQGTHLKLSNKETSLKQNLRLTNKLGNILIHHREEVIDFILNLGAIDTDILVQACLIFIDHEKNEMLRCDNETIVINIDMFSKFIKHPKMTSEGLDTIFTAAVEKELLSIINYLLQYNPKVTHHNIENLMKMYHYLSVTEGRENQEIIGIIRQFLRSKRIESGLRICRKMDEATKYLECCGTHSSAIKVYQNYCPGKIELDDNNEQEKIFIVNTNCPVLGNPGLLERLCDYFTSKKTKTVILCSTLIIGAIVGTQIFQWSRE